MSQWLYNLTRLLKQKPHEALEQAASIHVISTAAVPSLEEPEPLHKGKRRIKENYTSHWDLDYLPRAEAEKYLDNLPPT